MDQQKVTTRADSLGLDMNKIEGVGGPGIKYSFPHKPEVEGSLKPFVSQNGVK